MNASPFGTPGGTRKLEFSPPDRQDPAPYGYVIGAKAGLVKKITARQSAMVGSCFLQCNDVRSAGHKVGGFNERGLDDGFTSYQQQWWLSDAQGGKISNCI